MGAAVVPIVMAVASKAFVPVVSAGIAGMFGVAAGALTNVIAGALVGAATSALMGGDPMTGALFGGLGAGLGGVAGGLFGGGGGEAAAGAAAETASSAATAAAEGSTALAAEAPAAAAASLGGGVGPPPTTAYDAVASSLSKGGAVAEAAPNVFASPDPFGAEAFGGLGAGAGAESAALQGAATSGGLLDTILSEEVLGDAMAGVGKTMMTQGLVEGKIEKEGEEERKTAEFENQMRWQGITPEGSGMMLTSAMQNVQGTRAEALARGYSGRYGGTGSVARYKPQYTQGTLFEGAR